MIGREEKSKGRVPGSEKWVEEEAEVGHFLTSCVADTMPLYLSHPHIKTLFRASNIFTDTSRSERYART